MVDVIINWEVAVPTVRTNVRGASVAAATAVEAATAATAASAAATAQQQQQQHRYKKQKKDREEKETIRQWAIHHRRSRQRRKDPSERSLASRGGGNGRIEGQRDVERGREGRNGRGREKARLDMERGGADS
jgi:sRNA-binding protein